MTRWLTQAEAAAKWCQEYSPDPAQVQRDGATVPVNTRCIAAGCMAWDWQDTQIGDADPGGLRLGRCAKATVDPFRVGPLAPSPQR